MSELKFPVITITREYCAYGRTVAKELAKRLGVEFYDRDLVNKTVIELEYSGVAAGETKDNIEEFLKDMLGSVAAYSSSFEEVFAAQSKVILDLAKEPCIMVGRCANTILEKAGVESIDVFLYSDIDHRLTRCAELNPEMDEDQLMERLRRVDENRKIFYNTFGQCDMGDPHNYDICLNVGQLGIDGTVDAILALVK